MDESKDESMTSPVSNKELVAKTLVGATSVALSWREGILGHARHVYPPVQDTYTGRVQYEVYPAGVPHGLLGHPGLVVHVVLVVVSALPRPRPVPYMSETLPPVSDPQITSK